MTSIFASLVLSVSSLMAVNNEDIRCPHYDYLIYLTALMRNFRLSFSKNPHASWRSLCDFFCDNFPSGTCDDLIANANEVFAPFKGNSNNVASKFVVALFELHPSTLSRSFATPLSELETKTIDYFICNAFYSIARFAINENGFLLRNHFVLPRLSYSVPLAPIDTKPN